MSHSHTEREPCVFEEVEHRKKSLVTAALGGFTCVVRAVECIV